jgi:HD-GYP domain-containing protein (c-di-GMP phosphodiesterase class II)
MTVATALDFVPVKLKSLPLDIHLQCGIYIKSHADESSGKWDSEYSLLCEDIDITEKRISRIKKAIFPEKTVYLLRDGVIMELFDKGFSVGFSEEDIEAIRNGGRPWIERRNITSDPAAMRLSKANDENGSAELTIEEMEALMAAEEAEEKAKRAAKLAAQKAALATDGDKLGGNENAPTDGDKVGGNESAPTDGDKVGGNENAPTDGDKVGGNENAPTDGDKIGGQEKAPTDAKRPSGKDFVAAALRQSNKEEVNLGDKLSPVKEDVNRSDKLDLIKEEVNRGDKVDRVREELNHGEKVGIAKEAPPVHEAMDAVKREASPEHADIAKMKSESSPVHGDEARANMAEAPEHADMAKMKSESSPIHGEAAKANMAEVPTHADTLAVPNFHEAAPEAVEKIKFKKEEAPIQAEKLIRPDIKKEEAPKTAEKLERKKEAAPKTAEKLERKKEAAPVRAEKITIKKEKSPEKAHKFVRKKEVVLSSGRKINEIHIVGQTKTEEEERFAEVVKRYERSNAAANDLLDSIFATGKVDKKQGDIVVKDIQTQLEKTDASSIIHAINRVRMEDKYLHTHCLNVAFLNGLMGKWLRFGPIQQNDIVETGLLHDIGKLEIDQAILDKPTRLTKEEFEEIKKHPIKSLEVLVNSGMKNQAILDGVVQHHEKVNGTGYPYGLGEKEICEYARITSISDIYDAMVAKRVYKEARSPFEILHEFGKGAYSELDIKYVRTFIDCMIEELKGKIMIMNDGREATVLLVNERKLLYPIVEVDGETIMTNDNIRVANMKEVSVG